MSIPRFNDVELGQAVPGKDHHAYDEILAASGLYALEHNLGRVAEDHLAAQAFADAVGAPRPETNIVVIPVPDAPAVAAKLAEQGILVSVLGPTTLRAVTHMDVTVEECARAGRVMADAL